MARGRPPIPPRQLIRALKQLTEDIGETPTMKQMDQLGAHSSGTYVKKFGGWKKAIEKAGLPERDASNKKVTEERVKMYTNGRGWEILRYHDPRRFEWNEGEDFIHHRLLALAWFGRDEIEGNVIHHKNNIPWDNRESNLEVLTSEEHGRISINEYRDRITS